MTDLRQATYEAELVATPGRSLGSPDGPVALVGRAAEQGTLMELLSQVRQGLGQVIAVTGEMGLGKTTLLDWVEASAAGFVVLRASGREAEANLPFAGLTDLLRPLTQRVPDLPGPQADALGLALALTPGPSAVDNGAVSAAAVSLLSAPDRPLVVLVDDYHWLDTASRGVVDFVARRSQRLGLGVVIASREVYSEPGAHRIRLAPLTPDAAAALLRSRAPASPEVTARILALASGNPLALVELPLDLPTLESEPLADPGVSLSSALASAYRHRLDRLPPQSQQALLCAALENSGSVEVVRRAVRALGLDPDDLDAAEAAGLITVETSGYRFRHPLLRWVVARTPHPGHAVQVNRVLAEVAQDPDQRAWYLAAASTTPNAQVADALAQAAHRALARGAAGTAAAAFKRAAELSTSDQARSERLVSAARASHKGGNLTATARLLELARAAGATDDPRLPLLDADLRMRMGDSAGAYGALQLEAAGAAERDPRGAATMLLLAAKMRVNRLEAQAALQEVRAALALVPDDQWNSADLASLAMTTTLAGDPAARQISSRAMHLAARSPHGHIHTLGIGWPLLWLEEYELARAMISRAVSIQREGSHFAYLPQSLLAMAELEFRTGRWDLARSHAAEAITLFEDSEQPSEKGIASAVLARIEACRGEEADAVRLAAAAVASDVRFGLRVATTFAEAALGVLHLGRLRLQEAVAHLTRAQSLLQHGRIGEPWLLPVDADLAEAYARIGDASEAEAQATHLLERARRAGRVSAEAAGLRALGLIARDDAFAPTFEQALRLHDTVPSPFNTARTELCYGERLRRVRARAEARVRLRRALAIFENLGATPWADRARAELAAAGEVTWASSPLTTLTPQERQVAELVASGATNPEVAAQLFVTRKTIEFHLGNVYRKLGVRSRTELANTMSQVAHGELGA